MRCTEIFISDLRIPDRRELFPGLINRKQESIFAQVRVWQSASLPACEPASLPASEPASLPTCQPASLPERPRLSCSHCPENGLMLVRSIDRGLLNIFRHCQSFSPSQLSSIQSKLPKEAIKLKKIELKIIKTLCECQN